MLANPYKQFNFKFHAGQSVGKNRFSGQQKFWWYDHHRTFTPILIDVNVGLLPISNKLVFQKEFLPLQRGSKHILACIVQ
jgi:hypothetical protein